MRIDRLEAGASGVSAVIAFEGSGIERRIWYRRQDAAQGYACFAVAAYLQAMQAGESRLAVDGALDPALIAGLDVVGGYAAHWWGWRPPEIQATVVSAVPAQRAAASWFTGGVDSLFTLHRNLRRYPDGHPWRIRRALLSFGFDSALGSDNYDSVEERRSFERLAEALSVYLGRHGVTMEAVDTNARLGLDYGSFLHHLHGGFLAGMAHASGPGVYFLPSTHDISELIPFGSHPDVDGNMSSASTTIRHDGHEVPRLRKLELLRAWDVDLSAIHVCWATPTSGPFNCGKCQKCRRTIFELVAVGADDLIASGFPDADAGEVVRTIAPLSDTDDALLGAAAAAMRHQGRPALAVEEALRRRAAVKRRVAEQDWRGPPKRLLRRLRLRRS